MHLRLIMMNFMMMTMGIPTSRAKRMVNLLERLIKQEYMYTDEKLKELKAQIRVLKEEIAVKESKESKGFGK